MSDDDRARWDRRYADTAPVTVAETGLPAVFEPFAREFPATGHALELACGRGAAAVWLARRGMTVHGVDVSPLAIAAATELARAAGVARRCRFDVVDLDDGLPAGPPADVVVCHRFRDARLDQAVVDRLAPGGLVALSALSGTGRFRVAPGELRRVFAVLDLVADGEADGVTWLLARKPGEHN